MKKLAIIGASGHGKVVAEIATLNGWNNIFFFDDQWPGLKQLGPWHVSGNIKELLDNIDNFIHCIVAIGDNNTRMKIHLQIKQRGAIPLTLVHPKATISRYATLNEGSVVMANAVINPFAQIGEAAIINTGATIDHDCVLGNAVHISPGANLAGNVTLGDYSWIGVGASVKQQITIGAQVIVGAGAAVVQNIHTSGTYVGVPHRPI